MVLSRNRRPWRRVRGKRRHCNIFLADDPKRPGEWMAVDVQKIGSATPPDPARLFVANVPYTLTEAELLNLFAAHGSVEKLDLIRDSETGDSRGFAFCQMADARSALNAIARLHGAELGGRRISVRLAEARPGRGKPWSSGHEKTRLALPAREVKMTEETIELIRLFGIPTADELLREYAKRDLLRKSKREDRALTCTKIHRKITLGHSLDLLRQLRVLMLKKARIVKEKA